MIFPTTAAEQAHHHSPPHNTPLVSGRVAIRGHGSSNKILLLLFRLDSHFFVYCRRVPVMNDSLFVGLSIFEY